MVIDNAIFGYIELEEKLLTNKKAVTNMILKDMAEDVENYIKIKIIDSPSSNKKRVLYTLSINVK